MYVLYKSDGAADQGRGDLIDLGNKRDIYAHILGRLLLATAFGFGFGSVLGWRVIFSRLDWGEGVVAFLDVFLSLVLRRWSQNCHGPKV